jgi:hypothetical protein
MKWREGRKMGAKGNKSENKKGTGREKEMKREQEKGRKGKGK